MKCSEARTFLSQISDREEPITPVPPADLDYLSANGYVLRTTKEDYDKGVGEVARLSQLMIQVNAEKSEDEQKFAALQQDERNEHSFTFRFEGREEKDEVRQRIQTETDDVTKEDSELGELEANVNALIQEKSAIDRMVTYDGGYVSLTGLGTLVFNDLNVRNYRMADHEFSDFITEIKATYAELRSIADRATSYVNWIRPEVAWTQDEEY